MWRTAGGDRTLEKAEAVLFADALWNLLDEATPGEFDDYPLGTNVFDRLTYGQKISVLSLIGNGLLRAEVPSQELTAVAEGAIAAVFQHLKDCKSKNQSVAQIGEKR